MTRNQSPEQALRSVLNTLGATPAAARTLLESGDARAPAVVATLADLIEASDILGKTAHRVLGHVPEAADYHPPAEGVPVPPPPIPDAEALLARLAFLREHIVSTIDVQGADVWQRPAEDGRPLQAYAEELARADTVLLARLQEITRG